MSNKNKSILLPVGTWLEIELRANVDGVWTKWYSMGVWHNGHLLVIRGFNSNGNVLTNDPAGANDESVRITYNRQEFEKIFLNASNGTTYLIDPNG